jgi:O-antigen/teichoic acid export membrane protein
MLLEGFSTVMLVIMLALLCFAVFAFIDATLRREDAYRATDKKTKGFWLIILGLAVLVNVPFFGVGLWILKIIGLIATIVYIVDVRPALKQVMGGGGGPKRRGSSSDGPYGPFNNGGR